MAATFSTSRFGFDFRLSWQRSAAEATYTALKYAWLMVLNCFCSLTCSPAHVLHGLFLALPSTADLAVTVRVMGLLGPVCMLDDSKQCIALSIGAMFACIGS